MSNRTETSSTNNKSLCCNFCGKTQDQVEKLIAGTGVFICEACLKECDELLKTESTASAKDQNETDKCSFCAKPRNKVKSLLKGPDTHICDECIELCHMLLDDDEWSSVETVNVELPTPENLAKMGREQLFETIVKDVHLLAIWKERFNEDLQTHGIAPEEVENEVERRLKTPGTGDDENWNEMSRKDQAFSTFVYTVHDLVTWKERFGQFMDRHNITRDEVEAEAQKRVKATAK
jgi:hypothetical protein